MTRRRKKRLFRNPFCAAGYAGIPDFVLSPLVISLVLSVTDYNVMGAETHFVGLKNFKHLFDGTDIYFYKSLGVTAYYVLLSVPLQIIFAFSIALVLNTNIKGRSVFRTIFICLR